MSLYFRSVFLHLVNTLILNPIRGKHGISAALHMFLDLALSYSDWFQLVSVLIRDLYPDFVSGLVQWLSMLGHKP